MHVKGQKQNDKHDYANLKIWKTSLDGQRRCKWNSQEVQSVANSKIWYIVVRFDVRVEEWSVLYQLKGSQLRISRICICIFFPLTAVVFYSITNWAVLNHLELVVYCCIEVHGHLRHTKSKVFENVLPIVKIVISFYTAILTVCMLCKETSMTTFFSYSSLLFLINLPLKQIEKKQKSQF